MRYMTCNTNDIQHRDSKAIPYNPEIPTRRGVPLVAHLLRSNRWGQSPAVRLINLEIIDSESKV